MHEAPPTAISSARAVTARTGDPDAFSETIKPLTGWLNAHARSSRFHVDIDGVRVRKAALFRIRLLDALVEVDCPRDYVSVTIPLGRGPTIDVDGHPTVIHLGTAHIQRPDEEFRICTKPDTGGMLVANVDRSAIDETASMLGVEPGASAAFDRTVSISSSAGSQLYRRIDELMYGGSLDTMAEPSALAVEEAESALVDALISTGAHSPARADTGTPPATVRRAEEYIEANFAAPVTLADLAAASGVRRETLCRAFHKRYGVGPIGYLRRRRLEAVRRVLLGADPGSQSVTRTALRHGFTHLSQFAGQYRRLFGERPSETLAK